MGRVLLNKPGIFSFHSKMGFSELVGWAATSSLMRMFSQSVVEEEEGVVLAVVVVVVDDR